MLDIAFNETLGKTVGLGGGAQGDLRTRPVKRTYNGVERGSGLGGCGARATGRSGS